MFEQNVGQIDKIVRVILGIVFLVLAYFFFVGNGSLDLVLAIIMVILAVVMFVTAIFGTCPIWSLIKVNTNKT